jgi:hypothetical protein
MFAHEIDIDEAINQTDTLQGGSKGGDANLDGWHKDDEEKIFHLWQIKWSDNAPDATFQVSCIEEIAEAFRVLHDEDRRNQLHQKLIDVGVEMEEAIFHGYSVTLNIGLAGTLTDTAEAQVTALQSQLSKSMNCNVSIDIWDIEHFDDEHAIRHPVGEDLSGIKVDFPVQSNSLMELKSGDLSLPSGWEAAVVSLSAKGLSKAGSLHKSKLFGKNVRYSLSGKNKTISNIRKTATSKDESPFFWLYNNGITIVCDDFEIVAEPGGGSERVVKALNPQVVNGCQTVTAFWKAQSKLSSLTCVLARFIKPAPNQADKLMQVAEYTNSQNPVLARDLHANDPVQKSLRRLLDELNPPWFYERKTGEWMTLGAADKRRYSERKTNPIELGQSVWITIDPVSALAKKKQLFEDDDVYSLIFQKGRHINEYLTCLLLRRKFSEYWSDQAFGPRFDPYAYLYEDEAIYQKIKMARGQIESHCVYLFVLLFGPLTPESARKIMAKLPNFETSFAPILKHLFMTVVDYVSKIPVEQVKKTFESQTVLARDALQKNLRKEIHKATGAPLNFRDLLDT